MSSGLRRQSNRNKSSSPLSQNDMTDSQPISALTSPDEKEMSIESSHSPKQEMNEDNNESTDPQHSTDEKNKYSLGEFEVEQNISSILQITQTNDDSSGEDFMNSPRNRNKLLRAPLNRSTDQKSPSFLPESSFNEPCGPNRYPRIPESPPDNFHRQSSPIKDKTPKKENLKSSGSTNTCFKIICGVVILILPFVSGLIFRPIGDEISEQSNALAEDWNRNLLKLQKDFPSTKDWRAINVSASNIFRKRTQPGVLLLMGETEDSANCLAAIILSHFKNKPLDAKKMLQDHLEPLELKDSLYYAFNSSLSGQRNVGLLNIDHLSGQSAMVFHTFCDNENAPYPHSLIILTLSFPKDSPYEPQSAEQVIEEHLISLWTKNLSFDKASALVNRVIGYSAYVPAESLSPCS